MLVVEVDEVVEAVVAPWNKDEVEAEVAAEERESRVVSIYISFDVVLIKQNRFQIYLNLDASFPHHTFQLKFHLKSNNPSSNRNNQSRHNTLHTHQCSLRLLPMAPRYTFLSSQSGLAPFSFSMPQTVSSFHPPTDQSRYVQPSLHTTQLDLNLHHDHALR